VDCAEAVAAVIPTLLKLRCEYSVAMMARRTTNACQQACGHRPAAHKLYQPHTSTAAARRRSKTTDGTARRYL